jgi:hypothetical protein
LFFNFARRILRHIGNGLEFEPQRPGLAPHSGIGSFRADFRKKLSREGREGEEGGNGFQSFTDMGKLAKLPGSNDIAPLNTAAFTFKINDC